MEPAILAIIVGALAGALTVYKHHWNRKLRDRNFEQHQRML